MVGSVGVLTKSRISFIALNMVTCVAHEACTVFTGQVIAPAHTLEVLHNLGKKLGVLILKVKPLQNVILVVKSLQIFLFLEPYCLLIWANFSIVFPRQDF